MDRGLSAADRRLETEDWRPEGWKAEDCSLQLGHTTLANPKHHDFGFGFDKVSNLAYIHTGRTSLNHDG